ncbi:MAG: hypothetical protein CL916_13410 [Deltaproteobacteria bacterium]|nr:hypothetical protein [Deltaproteobacteria bacterium]
MLLFLIGCIFWKNNIGWNKQEKTHEIHLSSTIRYLHLFGPTAKLHLNPTPKYLSIGMEASPALIFSQILSLEKINEKMLKEIYFLSAIGIDFGGVHFSKEKTKISIFSPYVQLHTPAFCPVKERRTMLCITAYGESQYNIMLGHPNEINWNTGLSIHFGKGLFPY